MLFRICNQSIKKVQDESPVRVRSLVPNSPKSSQFFKSCLLYHCLHLTFGRSVSNFFDGILSSQIPYLLNVFDLGNKIFLSWNYLV